MAEIYDVIIIGAGPAGLSTASRLRERTPDALFTDEEHRRFSWIRKYGQKVPLKHVISGKTTTRRGGGAPQYNLAVLDSTSDAWMTRWNTLFDMYDISHLRSPMIWHADPFDRDSLLAYTYEERREKELVEIRNCVGKEISKHGHKKKACGGKQAARVAINVRERNDYYTPSRGIFRDHCCQVIKRYKLDNLVHRETVLDIDFGMVRELSDDDLFTIKTSASTRYARTVVLAVGAANTPKVPLLPSMGHATEHRQACHSMQIRQFPDPTLQVKVKARQATNVLVVGGGLTSAQLSDLAIRRGITRVWHIMRGPCRVKHFDLDLEWMGKYKNAEQAQFWLADSDAERLDIIKSARGGGSITPVFYKQLKKHIAAGKVKLHTNTQLVDALFDDDGAGGGSWTVTTEPPIELPKMDYIYFATGIQTDYQSLPYLQTMVRKHPIEEEGGLPCLNDDLMWKDGVPLFAVGRLAALRLGPGAANLGGAKVGAERVAWAIEDMISAEGDLEEKYREVSSYLSGHGNRYSSLAMTDDSS